jgi:predicted transglutaminase-like cysteine proteinase
VEAASPAAGAASPPAQADKTTPGEDWQPPRFFADLGMDQLNEINRTVNRAIRPTSDLAAFGKVEYWTIPRGSGAAGDCEDYVLAKRQALIQAGAPVESLSIAVVQTSRREMHTVLLVATRDGEVVLDNLTPWIVSWRAAPYTWLQRQARGSALTWVYSGLSA